MNGTSYRAIAHLSLVVSGLLLFASSAMAQCVGTWAQRMPVLEPSVRYYPGAAYDSARGVTVLFGGHKAIGNSDETWEWDGTNWSNKAPALAPSVRSGPAMAYDSARGVTVLFGGYDGADKGDTWEWNGTTWTLRTPALSPSPRSNHTMAYDIARGVIVLFGGSGAVFQSDTWEWDGSIWTQKSPANVPGARGYHAMAYDSARGVCVLFGGYANPATYYGDTWEWNGTNWTQLSPALSPSGRIDMGMAYDAARLVCVIFGGADAVAQTRETWEWNGTIWSKRMPVVLPSSRDSFGMAYDSARRVTVLFGGFSGGALGETWEWSGPLPAILQQPAAQSIASGQPAAFSITAEGLAPLTYRWRKDGTPLSDGGAIAGALTATIMINPSAVADNGTYTCLVTNSYGDILSRAAALTVTAPPSACGMCGAGMAMMMPFGALMMVVWRIGARRRRR